MRELSSLIGIDVGERAFLTDSIKILELFLDISYLAYLPYECCTVAADEFGMGHPTIVAGGNPRFLQRCCPTNLTWKRGVRC